MINEFKSKFSKVENNYQQQTTCNECVNLKSKLNTLFEEKAKEDAFNQSERIAYFENKVSKLKMKSMNCKEKCKRSLSQTTENFTLIGSSKVLQQIN